MSACLPCSLFPLLYLFLVFIMQLKHNLIAEEGQARLPKDCQHSSYDIVVYYVEKSQGFFDHGIIINVLHQSFVSVNINCLIPCSFCALW